jgi:TolB protein
VRIPLALFAALLLLSVGSGATASTTTPPQNGLIALNGPEGIYVVDPSAGTTKLVPESAEMSDPAWSPDGTLLAVSSLAGESSSVYTIKPDGTERTLVLEHAYSPSWSPDGKRLVVVREDTSDGDAVNALAIVDSDGSDARTLDLSAAESSQWLSVPEWSPDGRLIAFVAVDEDRATIELVSPDGKAVSMPKAEANGDTGLSWSPDSTSLAFDRYVETKNGGHSAAVVLDLATDRETVYAGEQLGAQAPTWSPEGDQLAFLSTSERPTSTTTTTTTHSCGGELFVSHLWVMSPNGTKAHRLVEGEYHGIPSWGRASEAGPAPAPVADQRPAPVAEQAPVPAADVPTPTSERTSKPALTSRPTPAPTKTTELPSVAKGLIAVRGSNAIYLVDVDSAATRKVPDTADMIAPSWSPDGSLLAVERVEKGGSSSIYTIWPNGSHPQLVLPNASLPSWSAEGDRIFAVRSECTTACEPEDDDANVLYAANLDGSNVQRVDFEEADVYDGRALAWPTDGSAIHFFDEESLTGPGSFDSSAAIWSPDGAQLVFVGSAGPTEEAGAGKTGLWIVSADGGRPHLLLSDASGRPSWVSS